MKDILEFILKNITTQPNDVRIEESDDNGVLHLTVTVNSEDVGRVIGKEGKIIKAIRSIMRVAAIQKGTRVRISVVSETEPASQESPGETPTPETPQQEVVLDQVETPENETPVATDTPKATTDRQTETQQEEDSKAENSLTVDVTES